MQLAQVDTAAWCVVADMAMASSVTRVLLQIDVMIYYVSLKQLLTFVQHIYCEQIDLMIPPRTCPV
jgi:hypothetical protein